ncbi:hypothetical protein O1L44_24365 [Streptomyces noursei]|nr:hypothetical protein [Streptomyces noursei]
MEGDVVPDRAGVQAGLSCLGDEGGAVAGAEGRDGEQGAACVGGRPGGVGGGCRGGRRRVRGGRRAARAGRRERRQQHGDAGRGEAECGA